MDIVQRAKDVLDIEAKAIVSLKNNINADFKKAVQFILNAKGRVVVTGVGKTGIIAQKFSATLSSTGTPSLFLHSAEAIHGDLGRVIKDDVVVILSYSGESDEIKKLLPVLKKIGSKIISITGNVHSLMAVHSDVVLNTAVKKEACPLNLAPTASTTAMLAMSDALAVCLLELKGFKENDFAFYHPGGSLGRRLLLTVGDIMRKGSANPIADGEKKVSEVLMKITAARAGSAAIVDKKGRLSGIFTDGDLRRHLGEGGLILSRRVKEVMTKNPVTVSSSMLAQEAMRILEEKKIDEVPVVDALSKPVGLLDIQDLLKAGLV